MSGTSIGARLSSTLAFGLAFAFIASQLLVQSTFSELGGHALTRLSVVVSTLAVAGGVILALAQGQLLAMAVLLGFGLLLVIQCYVFASVTGLPANFNALFSFLNVIAFPLFSLRGLNLNRLFLLTFIASMAYCLIYVVKYDDFVASAEAATATLFKMKGSAAALVEVPGVRVLVGDTARGTRVFLAAGFSTFAFFYALVRMLTERKLRWLLCLVCVGGAIVMSLSRAYMAILLVVSAAHLFRLTGRPQRLIFAALFLVAATFIVSGVPVERWNPLGLTSGDMSGAVRSRAYDVIRNFVNDHYLLGVGIAPDPQAQAALVGTPSVFWPDLGTLGVWYTFGLLGLLVYCAEMVIITIGPSRPPELSVTNHRVLLLCGIVVGLYACLSPDAWGGSNGVIAAIIIGILTRQARPLPRVAAFWFGVERMLFGSRDQPLQGILTKAAYRLSGITATRTIDRQETSAGHKR